MASTRALAVAVVFGGLCGGGIYAAVPANPGGVDVHAARHVWRSLEQINPIEARLHGCVTKLGRPATNATVQLDVPQAVDHDGCFDIDVPYQQLGDLTLSVWTRYENEHRLAHAEVRAGQRVDLGAIELGEPSTQLVRGVVRDRDGHPVAGVHVDAGPSTLVHHATEDDGAYWLRVGTGRYTLQVRRFEHGLEDLDSKPATVEIDEISDDPLVRDITLR